VSVPFPFPGLFAVEGQPGACSVTHRPPTVSTSIYRTSLEHVLPPGYACQRCRPRPRPFTTPLVLAAQLVPHPTNSSSFHLCEWHRPRLRCPRLPPSRLFLQRTVLILVEACDFFPPWPRSPVLLATTERPDRHGPHGANRSVKLHDLPVTHSPSAERGRPRSVAVVARAQFMNHSFFSSLVFDLFHGTPQVTPPAESETAFLKKPSWPTPLPGAGCRPSFSEWNHVHNPPCNLGARQVRFGYRSCAYRDEAFASDQVSFTPRLEVFC